MKTAEGVALQIVRDIVARDLATGDRLPLEADMLRQYQVSRASLREALRILEVQGVISLKPGPWGGPVVGAVEARYLARTSALYFHIAGASYDELFRAHVMLEPLNAELAASHPDRKYVKERLTPFVRPDRALEGPEYWEHTSGFHDTIFELSGNRVVSLVTKSIGHIVFDQVMSGMEPVHLRAAIAEDHAAIAKAVILGRKQQSARLMRDHFQHLFEHYKEKWPWRFDQVIEWR